MLEVKIGPTSLEYEFDDGSKFPIIKDIIKITGYDKVAVITKVRTSDDCRVSEMCNAIVDINITDLIGSKTVLYFHEFDKNNADSYLFEEVMITTNSMIDISGLKVYKPAKGKFYIFDGGNSRKVISYIIAKNYMEHNDFGLDHLCKVYVEGIANHIKFDIPLDKLATILYDSIVETVNNFNERFIEPIINGREEKDEST